MTLEVCFTMMFVVFVASVVACTVAAVMAVKAEYDESIARREYEDTLSRLGLKA